MKRRMRAIFFVLCAIIVIEGAAWAASAPSGVLVCFDYSATYDGTAATDAYTISHVAGDALPAISMDLGASKGQWQFTDTTDRIDGFHPNDLTVSNPNHSINQSNPFTLADVPFHKWGKGQLILAAENDFTNVSAVNAATIVHEGSLVIRHDLAVISGSNSISLPDSTLTVAGGAAVSVDVNSFYSPGTITNAGVFELTRDGVIVVYDFVNAASGTVLVKGFYLTFPDNHDSHTVNNGVYNITDGGIYSDTGGSATFENNAGATLNIKNGSGMDVPQTDIVSRGRIIFDQLAYFGAQSLTLKSGSFWELTLLQSAKPDVEIGSLDVSQSPTINVKGDVGSYKLSVSALTGTPRFVDNQGRSVTWTYQEGVLTITIHESVSIPNVIPSSILFDCLAPTDKKFVLNNAALTAAKDHTLALSIEGRAIDAANYSFDGKNLVIRQGFFKTLTDDTYTIVLHNSVNHSQVGKITVTVLNSCGGSGEGNSFGGCNTIGLGAGVLLMGVFLLFQKSIRVSKSKVFYKVLVSRKASKEQ